MVNILKNKQIQPLHKISLYFNQITYFKNIFDQSILHFTEVSKNMFLK